MKLQRGLGSLSYLELIIAKLRERVIEVKNVLNNSMSLLLVTMEEGLIGLYAARAKIDGIKSGGSYSRGARPYHATCMSYGFIFLLPRA